MVTNVEPKKSFLGMVGEEHLPAFVTRVKNYHSRGRSLFVLHLALSEPPQYRASAQNSPVNVAFSQEMFGGSVEDQVRAYQEIAMGRAPRKEMLQITLPTLFDPSQAPPAGTPRSSGNTRLTRCRAAGGKCARSTPSICSACGARMHPT